METTSNTPAANAGRTTVPAKLRGVVVDYYEAKGIGRIIDLNSGSYYFFHRHGFCIGVPRIGMFVDFVKSTIPPKPNKLPVAIFISVIQEVVDLPATTDVGVQSLAEPNAPIAPAASTMRPVVGGQKADSQEVK
jgi:hypothetical protein